MHALQDEKRLYVQSQQPAGAQQQQQPPPAATPSPPKPAAESPQPPKEQQAHSSDGRRARKASSKAAQMDAGDAAAAAAGGNAEDEDYVENEQELFCVCQQPYNVDTAMIECDACAEWYHLKCVGLTQVTLSLSPGSPDRTMPLPSP
jgi:hypothetical protein